jgi:YD repeat-containing protein
MPPGGLRSLTPTPPEEIETETVPYQGTGTPPSRTAITSYTCHPAGQLASVTNPNGGRTDYTYDPRGNRLRRRDTYDPDPGPAGGRIVQQWRYDLGDRLTQAW